MAWTKKPHTPAVNAIWSRRLAGSFSRLMAEQSIRK